VQTLDQTRLQNKTQTGMLRLCSFWMFIAEQQLIYSIDVYCGYNIYPVAALSDGYKLLMDGKDMLRSSRERRNR
jgi:hypothetical protein